MTFEKLSFRTLPIVQSIYLSKKTSLSDTSIFKTEFMHEISVVVT